MDKKIFEFIKTKTPNLARVISVQDKQTDNEHGSIDEHFVVKCVLRVPNTSIPIHNLLGEKEATCLVDVSEFNRWLKNESSVKWI
jgi:hypothetical protein